MKLTLLGTGCPTPSLKRRGPGQVIEAGDSLILIDCGAGTMHQLLKAGYEGRPITHLAFTHLHSDHVSGLLDLLSAGWIRRRPPSIYGPPGTRHFVEYLLESMAYDTRVRGAGAGRRAVPVEEFEEGWAIEGQDWRLSTFRVDHMPVDQAFGFRIDQDGASVVVSGDTKPCDNLVKHAESADVLVHEVYWTEGLKRARDASSSAELRMSYHTSSEDVGKVATRAGARHLVLSHIDLGRITGAAEPDYEESLLADVRPNFTGELTLGEDLMTFEVKG